MTDLDTLFYCHLALARKNGKTIANNIRFGQMLKNYQFPRNENKLKIVLEGKLHLDKHLSPEQHDILLDFHNTTFGEGKDSSWCGWKPSSESVTALVWEFNEETPSYLPGDWIKVIINRFLIPWGITAEGEVSWIETKSGKGIFSHCLHVPWAGILSVMGNEVSSIRYVPSNDHQKQIQEVHSEEYWKTSQFVDTGLGSAWLYDHQAKSRITRDFKEPIMCFDFETNESKILTGEEIIQIDSISESIVVNTARAEKPKTISWAKKRRQLPKFLK